MLPRIFTRISRIRCFAVIRTSSAVTSSYPGYHLIPLALGGDPNDPRNLWVEPQASPNPKDDVEFRLIQLVCRRKASLADAQAAIASDWTTAVDVVTHRS